MDRITQAAHLALNVRMERSAVIASNVANKDTPGYTPVDLKFSDTLARFINDGKAPTPPPMAQPSEGRGVVGLDRTSLGEVFFDPGRLPGQDGNSVDLDREQAKMAENAMSYQAAIKIIRKKQGFMSYAVRGGRMG
jgi:flagellar basal-body rod protein FlgB